MIARYRQLCMELMMNNEPVAWMQSKTKELPDGCECMQSVSLFKANDTDIPLYTHPAKTLTDEEIELMKHFLQANQLYLSFEEWKHGDSARAILRKAQEK